MCNISTVQQKKVTIGVCEITKCIGRYFISTQKKHSFLEKFTQLARILHDRRSNFNSLSCIFQNLEKYEAKM